MTVAAQSKACTVLDGWNSVILGSNSTRGMHVCPLCSLLCCPAMVDRDLAMGQFSAQGVLPNVRKDQFIQKLILNWNEPSPS
jgi:hypothetical protein